MLPADGGIIYGHRSIAFTMRQTMSVKATIAHAVAVMVPRAPRARIAQMYSFMFYISLADRKLSEGSSEGPEPDRT